MSRRTLRRTTLMWTGVGFMWAVALAVLATLWLAGEDLHPGAVLLLGVLLVLVSGVAAVVHTQSRAHGQREEALALLRQIRDAQPTAEAIAAHGLVNGHGLARTAMENEAQVPRIGGYRG